MDVRATTAADAAALAQLAPNVDPGVLADGIGAIAEEDGRALAILVADAGGTVRGLAIDEQAWGSGVFRKLSEHVLDELERRGVQTVRIEVPAGDAQRIATLERIGYRPERLVLAAPLQELRARLEPEPAGRSYGAVYVQSDDAAPLLRTLGRFVPRLADAQLTEPRDGWIQVTDPQMDADPRLLRRVGHELSVVSAGVVFVLGVEDDAVVRYALLDRGSLIDEYLSVPEYYGPLPSGDVVALSANPTAVARLTGADPGAVRAVCRTVTSPSDLPPADALLRQIAEVVGLWA
jgi:GNAT superfamily N-acetyltransferase